MKKDLKKYFDGEVQDRFLRIKFFSHMETHYKAEHVHLPNDLSLMMRKKIKLASLFSKSLLFSTLYVLFYIIITSCIMYKLEILL